MSSDRRRLDWTIAALLLGVAVVYQTLWPRDLNGADEALFLYEAKRLLDGDVMYRDIFQFVTPGAWYAMTLLYRVFGVDFATARIAMAVLHGLVAVLTYATGRRMGARPAVAVVAAVAYLGISQPVWPIASPHWFSTLLTMWLCWCLLADDAAERPRQTFLIGLLCGVLIMVQQQKGVITGLGVGGILVVDHLCSRRYGTASALLPRLMALAAGVLAVTVPCLLVLMAMGGFAPMFDALVRFPLGSYRRAHGTPFGGRGVLSGSPFWWVMWAMAHMPWLLVPPAARAVWLLIRGTDRRTQRRLTVLVLSSVTAVATVLYDPDYIHLAFVSPPFLVAAAGSVEWALHAFGARERLANVVATTVAAVLLVMLGLHMGQHLLMQRAAYPFSLETAFGRVDYRTHADVKLIETLRTMLAAEPSPTLYTYPATNEPYLTAGGRNPTRFELLEQKTNPPEHTDEVLAVLEREQVQLVVMAPLLVRPDDRIRRYVDDYFDLVDIGEIPSVWLYKRRLLRPAPAPER